LPLRALEVVIQKLTDSSVSMKSQSDFRYALQQLSIRPARQNYRVRSDMWKNLITVNAKDPENFKYFISQAGNEMADRVAKEGTLIYQLQVSN